MKKVLIVFGTTTGNTEDMAGIIGEALNKSGIDTEIMNVTEVRIQDLKGDYDLVILGCPAYGIDDIELQDDFAEFYEEMDEIDLKDRVFAVFAPGDSSYEHFCGSVDMLEEKIDGLGGKKVVEGLKIDGDPMDYRDEIREWAESAASAIK